MKQTFLHLFSLAASISLALAQARAPSTAPPPPPPPPPPVYLALTVPSTNTAVYVYDQKPAGGRSYLIAPEQAQSIINRFKEEYKKMGTPRFLIYVNRELIDEKSGLKLSSHKQVIESTRATADHGPRMEANADAKADNGSQTARVSSTNIYRLEEPKETPLADRQTMRDVERLFGRPLRLAGAHLADQRVANQLIDSKALDHYAIQPDSEQARKDREALTKVADIVLEILVSSHETVVSDISGDSSFPAPDIQATAIRLSDARILGQATAADLIGQGASAGHAARTFGIREITEATALSLMEDMMLQ